MLVEGQDGGTRTWRRTVEEDVKGKDRCGCRGCRTESRGDARPKLRYS